MYISMKTCIHKRIFVCVCTVLSKYVYVLSKLSEYVPHTYVHKKVHTCTLLNRLVCAYKYTRKVHTRIPRATRIYTVRNTYLTEICRRTPTYTMMHIHTWVYVYIHKNIHTHVYESYHELDIHFHVHT